MVVINPKQPPTKTVGDEWTHGSRKIRPNINENKKQFEFKHENHLFIAIQNLRVSVLSLQKHF